MENRGRYEEIIKESLIMFEELVRTVKNEEDRVGEVIDGMTETVSKSLIKVIVSGGYRRLIEEVSVEKGKCGGCRRRVKKRDLYCAGCGSLLLRER